MSSEEQVRERHGAAQIPEYCVSAHPHTARRLAPQPDRAKPPCAVDRALAKNASGTVGPLCPIRPTPSSDCGTTVRAHSFRTVCKRCANMHSLAMPFGHLTGLFRVHLLFRHCCCPLSFHSSRCAGVGSSGSSTWVQSAHLQLCSQASRIPFYLPLAQREGVQCVSRFLFAHTICTAVP